MQHCVKILGHSCAQHSRGPPRVEKVSRDCLEHLWTIQSSPRPRSNSYFYLFAVQSAPNTDQIQLRPPLNEVSYDPFGRFGRQTAHLRPPSGWRKFPTRPPNCYWVHHHLCVDTTECYYGILPVLRKCRSAATNHYPIPTGFLNHPFLSLMKAFRSNFELIYGVVIRY